MGVLMIIQIAVVPNIGKSLLYTYIKIHYVSAICLYNCICVCVCARVRVCACARVRVCVCLCVCVHAACYQNHIIFLIIFIEETGNKSSKGFFQLMKVPGQVLLFFHCFTNTLCMTSRLVSLPSFLMTTVC